VTGWISASLFGADQKRLFQFPYKALSLLSLGCTTGETDLQPLTIINRGPGLINKRRVGNQVARFYYG
jgi:hypothetical protein